MNKENLNSMYNKIDKLHSSGLNKDLEKMNFQLDFINREITPMVDLTNYLNDNSSRLQHLMDEEPVLIRWWFDELSKALEVVRNILEKFNTEGLSFRLICLEKNSIIIQNGNL